jgi:hypothetical protein
MHGNGLSVGAYYKPLFLTIGVTFWSVRLAGFLFYRILQTQTDKCALLCCVRCKRHRAPAVCSSIHCLHKLHTSRTLRKPLDTFAVAVGGQVCSGLQCGRRLLHHL